MWLEYCSKLKILDLSRNKISDISVLKKCKFMSELFLNYNPIE